MVIPSTPALPLLAFTCCKACFRFSRSQISSISRFVLAGLSGSQGLDSEEIRDKTELLPQKDVGRIIVSQARDGLEIGLRRFDPVEGLLKFWRLAPGGWSQSSIEFRAKPVRQSAEHLANRSRSNGFQDCHVIQTGFP